jgi:hypothetical protein
VGTKMLNSRISIPHNTLKFGDNIFKFLTIWYLGSKVAQALLCPPQKERFRYKQAGLGKGNEEQIMMENFRLHPLIHTFPTKNLSTRC